MSCPGRSARRVLGGVAVQFARRSVGFPFDPSDNTMVCKRQFCSYRDRGDEFAALDALPA